MESKRSPPESLAKREDRLPSGGCRNAPVVADGVDEQLHSPRCCLLPHLLPPPSLAPWLQLVSGWLTSSQGRGYQCWLNACQWYDHKC